VKLRLSGVLAVALLTSGAAQATVPGTNGPILFLRQVGAYEQVFTARSDGTRVRQLTRFADTAAADPSWSADGRRIAFARNYGCCNPKTEHLDIYTMNADGTGLHGIGFKGLNRSPLWFPNGKRILYGRRGGLWVVPAAGGRPHLMLKIAGDFEGPALSPNGQKVAFVRTGLNRSALVVADLSTGFSKRITPWTLNASPKIDWSPNGSLLLSRTLDGRIFTIRPDGAGLRILRRGNAYCSDSFSPDGMRVLYIDHCGAGGSKGHMFTMKLDGSDVKPIPNLIGHWVSWAPRAR
jgi:Tol biopolymer transport system component